MDDKLYFCKYWSLKRLEINNDNYSICISDKIDGNKQGSTIQYHGLIMKGDEVATLGLLNKGITEKKATELLKELEKQLRNVLISILKWKDYTIDREVVKIWYYTKSGNVDKINVNDKRIYPPLRFAFTVVNIIPMDKNIEASVKSNLEDTLENWLKNIVNFKPVL